MTKRTTIGYSESDLGNTPRIVKVDKLHIAGCLTNLDSDDPVPSDQELLDEIAERNGLCGQKRPEIELGLERLEPEDQIMLTELREIRDQDGGEENAAD